MWAPWAGAGLEHLQLVVSAHSVFADGLVIGTRGESAFRLRYELRCDAEWRTRRITATLGAGADERRLQLFADGEGRWTTEIGDRLSALDGCLDVDISVSPFTNTLPIRRLRLAPEESAEIAVAYLEVPSLELAVVTQRYTCLQDEVAGGLWRFEAPDAGFTADLQVDGDGLVLDHPLLFRRVWPPRPPAPEPGESLS